MSTYSLAKATLFLNNVGGDLLQLSNKLLWGPLMFKSRKSDKLNIYIRERIKQARLETGESQEVLAKIMEKTRAAISDLERGRVSVNASDLGFIAAYYEKPISYFYPPRLKIDKDDLSSLDQELLLIFWQLPEIQQLIAFEYVKQQLDVVNKAESRSIAEKKSKGSINT